MIAPFQGILTIKEATEKYFLDGDIDLLQRYGPKELKNRGYTEVIKRLIDFDILVWDEEYNCPVCDSANYLKVENEILREAIEFIADQEHLQGQWALTRAKLAIRECEGLKEKTK